MPTAPHPALAQDKVRELKVGIAVTEAMKLDHGWHEKIKQRLGYASKIFESEFGIKLKPTVYWTWEISEDKQDSGFLLDHLMTHYSLEEKQVDVIIGLGRLDASSRLTQSSDLDTIGRARPFSGYLVLRSPMKPLFKAQEETSLVHELGHLFGGVHTQDTNSIMAPVIDKQLPSSFDLYNREIIKLARQIDFQKGLKSLPESVSQNLLQAYLQMQHTEQTTDFYYALGVFYLTSGKQDDAVKAWKTVLKKDPNNIEAGLDLGILYSKIGESDLAIKELSNVVGQIKASGQNYQKAQALTWLGVAYFKRGSYETAHQVWSRALVLEPDNMDIKMNLATVQLKRGKYDEAISVFAQALERNPQNPKVLSNLGSAYFQMGQYQKSIDYLTQALKFAARQRTKGDVNDIDAAEPSVIYMRLGHAFLKVARSDDAIKSYRKACELNPSVECKMRVAQTYYQLGQYHESASELAQILQVEKEDPDVYGMLGASLSKQGDSARAEGVFREGLKYAKTKPAKAMLHRNLGHMYLQSRKLEYAQMEFELSLSDEWKNADTHLALAFVFLGMGQTLDARQSLLNVLSINPSDARAKSMLANLEASLRKS